MTTVYMAHLDSKMGHTGHYIGTAEDLEARIAEHRETRCEACEPYQTEHYGISTWRKVGSGAKYLGMANTRGILWRIVRTWEGGRDLEKRIKALKMGPELCPICVGEAAYRRAQFDKSSKPASRSDADDIEIPF